MNQGLFIGLGTTFFVGTVFSIKRIERRYEEAKFAELYGCLDYLHEEEKEKVRKNLKQYMSSYYRLITENTPYNLGFVFHDTDFDDDPPRTDSTFGIRFQNLN
jgi:hypothetical protein